MAAPALASFQDRACYLIATGGGVGAIRFAPGTWGAGVAALLYGGVLYLPSAWHLGAISVLLVLSCLGTIAVGGWAERYFGKKDPGSFVSDEIAGLLLTLLFFHLPLAPLRGLFWAFVFTRIFDIAKFPPARQLEKLPRGWGVLLDDLASSVYAIAALWLIRWWQPLWFS